MKHKLCIIIFMMVAMLLGGCTESVESTERVVESEEVTKESNIKDTLSAENFDFKIISATTGSSFTNDLGAEYSAEDDKELLMIVFSATNTSSDTMNAMYSGFDSYVDDNKVTVESVAGEIDGYMPLIGAVDSGKTFEAYAIWQVPKGWNKFEFSYIDSLTGSESDSFVIYADDVD